MRQLVPHECASPAERVEHLTSTPNTWQSPKKKEQEEGKGEMSKKVYPQGKKYFKLKSIQKKSKITLCLIFFYARGVKTELSNILKLCVLVGLEINSDFQKVRQAKP